MKSVYIALSLACLVTLAPATLHAQDAASTLAAQVAAGSAPTNVTVQPAAVEAPAAVVVPEPAAPPEWATKILLTASELPIVGPILSKALLYLGIFAALLTSLVGFLLGAIVILQKGFSAAGLAKFAAVLAAFRDGKIMYYLKFLSNFNAKKPQ